MAKASKFRLVLGVSYMLDLGARIQLINRMEDARALIDKEHVHISVVLLTWLSEKAGEKIYQVLVQYPDSTNLKPQTFIMQTMLFDGPEGQIEYALVSVDIGAQFVVLWIEAAVKAK